MYKFLIRANDGCASIYTHIITDTHIEPTAGFDNWCQNTGLSMFSFEFYGAPYAPRRKSGRQSALGILKTNMEC